MELRRLLEREARVTFLCGVTDGAQHPDRVIFRVAHDHARVADPEIASVGPAQAVVVLPGRLVPEGHGQGAKDSGPVVGVQQFEPGVEPAPGRSGRLAEHLVEVLGEVVVAGADVPVVVGVERDPDDRAEARVLDGELPQGPAGQ